MRSLIARHARILIGVVMAGVVGAAMFLERRRSGRTASTRPALADSVDEPSPESAEEAPVVLKPLLSPLRFTVSHFGLLVLLLAMSGGGLALRGIKRYPSGEHFHVNGGDAARGREVMIRYGCGGCHAIPGIRGASGNVGPGLGDFGQRMYIGGQLPNTPEHLIAWLQDPPRYAPGTAMPDLGVTEAEARDIAAFFYTR